MKSFKLILLSLFLTVLVASATEYTIFDISSPSIWNGDTSNGWENTTVIDGKTFSFKYERGEAKDDQELLSPVYNTFAWRMYKGTKVTLNAPGVPMTSIIFTYDDYNSGQYIGSLTLSSGWSGSLDGVVFTAVSAGQDQIVLQALDKQVRIKKIVVSDEGGTIINPPIEPDIVDGIVYQNSFQESLDGWDKINDSSVSDFNGWKINSNEPKCAICNSYYGGANHPANSKLQRTFDLSGIQDTQLVFEQAFGYDFPSSQNEFYKLYVVHNNSTYYLDMANFPPVPETKWTSWVSNTFDLSEYDGESISIGFEYTNDGNTSRAWEIRNFVINGAKSTAEIENINHEDAPVYYYNLQGVKVSQPEKGFYIKVQGSSVSKILL